MTRDSGKRGLVRPERQPLWSLSPRPFGSMSSMFPGIGRIPLHPTSKTWSGSSAPWRMAREFWPRKAGCTRRRSARLYSPVRLIVNRIVLLNVGPTDRGPNRRRPEKILIHDKKIVSRASGNQLLNWKRALPTVKLRHRQALGSACAGMTAFFTRVSSESLCIRRKSAGVGREGGRPPACHAGAKPLHGRGTAATVIS